MNSSLTLACLVVVYALAIPGSAFGQTWTPVLDTDPNTNYWITVASSADGATLVAAACGGPIVVSTNSGANWIETAAPYAEWDHVACSADGAKLVAVVGGLFWSGLIYVSTNTGATWITTTAPTTPWTAVACSADGTKIVAAGFNSPVFASTNGGASWTPRSLTFGGGGYGPSIACSTDGMRLIAASGNSGDPLYISSDFGMTWTPASALYNSGWEAVASSADGTTLMAAGGHSDISSILDEPMESAICLSSDGGMTWTTNIFGFTAFCGAAASADGHKLVAIAGPLPNTVVMISTNSGVDFEAMFGQPPGVWTAVSFSSDGSQLAVTEDDYPIYTARYMPPLNLALIGKNGTLSWPALASSSALCLTESPDLASTNWSAVTAIPVLANGQYSVTITASNSQSFYRLSNQ
jgi:hypothetical protein